MKKRVLAICLLGIGALWGWALFWPKSVETLPKRFWGEFVLFQYVPPKDGSQDNPYPENETRHFHFTKEGQYLIRILVGDDYEMRRQEGVVEMLEDGVIQLTQVSVDRVEGRDGPWRYVTRWDRDKTGDFLRLREIEKGHELHLRKLP